MSKKEPPSKPTTPGFIPTSPTTTRKIDDLQSKKLKTLIPLILTSFLLAFTSVQTSLSLRNLDGPTTVMDTTIPVDDEATTSTTSSGSSSSSSSSMPLEFSACLLIMDDNHWLVEWIAYHYHMMPLRNLVVLPDPSSKTSPKPILDRWKGRMDIELWNDAYIGHAKGLNDTDGDAHNWRQSRLYQTCLKHFKSKGKSWVMLTDTDEFLDMYIPEYHQVVSIPQNIKQLETMNVTFGLPNTAFLKPGFFADYLRHEHETKKVVMNDPTAKPPVCINLARYTVPAKDIDSKDWSQAQTMLLQSQEGKTKKTKVHHYFHHQNAEPKSSFDPLTYYPTKGNSVVDPQHMLTTRFLYYRPGVLQYLLPKVIIDVSAMEWTDFPSEPPLAPTAQHQVIPKHCIEPKVFQKITARSLLRHVHGNQERPRLILRHYTGTQEQFNFREDHRNYRKAASTDKRWNSEVEAARLFDLSVVPWVKGFIDRVGAKEAKRLLKGVGNVNVQ